jgi:CSLREA domain-containing protein
MIKTKQFSFVVALTVILLLVGVSVRAPRVVHAADNDFSDGITVDSTLDSPDDNVGDGICDDGAGNCTLRAAIEEANNDVDASVINFNISGTADFTNDGQDGYTIQPNSALPDVTDTLTINGYSQPGALANTAVSPNPLDGILLIEIDGTNADVAQGITLIDDSDNSIIKGLVINNFDQGDAIHLRADGISVHGNYIGTDPTGFIARPNVLGVNTSSSGDPDRAENVQVGGLNPADRNLISGNTAGTAAAASYPGNGWIFQGNYIGVSADGITPLPNANPDGSGSISSDDNSGVLIGGNSAGAANVISGNNSFGIAPHNSADLVVQGNLVGTDYTGTAAVPNSAYGMAISGTSTNFLVGGTTALARNVFSGNVIGLVISGSSTGSVTGNYIGLNAAGSAAIPNTIGGLYIASTSGEPASGITVGGTAAGARNVISGNHLVNIGLQGIYDNVTNSNLMGNYIGTNANGEVDSSITTENGGGILLYGNITENTIGGTSSGAGNLIAGNKGFGVGVANVVSTAFGFSRLANNNAILGNSIYATSQDSGIATPNGIGIDLARANHAGGSPLFPNTYTYVDLDTNTNALAGSVPGEANDYLSHPVLSSFTYTGMSATAKLNLAAAGASTNTYRVEFFANDDSSQGQGKTYLGSATANSADNQTASLTLPSGIDMAGKYVTATSTRVNGISSDTNHGFGSTSEYSEPIQAVVLGEATANPSGSGNLADTGDKMLTSFVGGILIISSAVIVGLVRRKIVYRLYR